VWPCGYIQYQVQYTGTPGSIIEKWQMWVSIRVKSLTFPRIRVDCIIAMLCVYTVQYSSVLSQASVCTVMYFVSNSR
jgi:hypothetical protein